MKKIVVAVSLIILCATVSAAQSAHVIKKQANIRERPSNTAKIVMKVSVNTVVKLESRDHINGWYYVSRNKVKGWIYGDTIKIKDESVDLVNSGNAKDYSKIYKDEWIEFEASVSGTEWYNPGKMTRQGFIVSVWRKTVNKSTYKTVAMVRAELNCRTSYERVVAGVFYNSDGSVRSSGGASARGWSMIIPDTIIEALKDIVCKL